VAPTGACVTARAGFLFPSLHRSLFFALLPLIFVLHFVARRRIIEPSPANAPLALLLLNALAKPHGRGKRAGHSILSIRSRQEPHTLLLCQDGCRARGRVRPAAALVNHEDLDEI
jgi:hypothetical protein